MLGILLWFNDRQWSHAGQFAFCMYMYTYIHVCNEWINISACTLCVQPTICHWGFKPSYQSLGRLFIQFYQCHVQILWIYKLLPLPKFFPKKWLPVGFPKITFDLISIHFTSIHNLNFFGNFWQNGWRRPFWMSEFHFRWHFWPFQIDRPYWISEIHFLSQFWPFQIDAEFLFFPAAILDVWKSLWIAFLPISDWSAILDVRNSLPTAFLAISDPYGTLFFYFLFFTKWPPAAILDGTTMSIIELVRDIWMSNACVKFEERSLNPSKVIALTTKLWRGGSGPCGGCCIHTTTRQLSHPRSPTNRIFFLKMLEIA